MDYWFSSAISLQESFDTQQQKEIMMEVEGENILIEILNKFEI